MNEVSKFWIVNLNRVLSVCDALAYIAHSCNCSTQCSLLPRLIMFSEFEYLPVKNLRWGCFIFIHSFGQTRSGQDSNYNLYGTGGLSWWGFWRRTTLFFWKYLSEGWHRYWTWWLPTEAYGTFCLPMLPLTLSQLFPLRKKKK